MSRGNVDKGCLGLGLFFLPFGLGVGYVLVVFDLAVRALPLDRGRATARRGRSEGMGRRRHGPLLERGGGLHLLGRRPKRRPEPPARPEGLPGRGLVLAA